MRKNSYKGNRTPYEIIKEEEDMKYATLPKTILDFPTCILDEKFYAFIRGGYHVSLPTKYRSSLLYRAIVFYGSNFFFKMIFPASTPG